MTRSLSTVHTRKGVSSTLRPYLSHIAKQIFLQFLRGGWGKWSVITWNFSPETRQVLNGIHPTILTPLKSNLIGGKIWWKKKCEREKILLLRNYSYNRRNFSNPIEKTKTKGKPDSRPISPPISLELVGIFE